MSPLIEINRFGYAYPNPQPGSQPEWVLRDLSLQVQAGEFLSIMGPTGSGKSTLCMALNGSVPRLTGGVIRGDVLIAGLNTKTHPVADLARIVGVVLQDPDAQLFQPSVEAEVAFGLENLGVARLEIRRRVDWALAQVDMSSLAAGRPARLSGGQKQRVAIASILAMTPQILVLDEPTAFLDPRGKSEVFAVIDRLRRSQSSTIILASHESEAIAEFSDRIIVLSEGGIALDGAPQSVFEQAETMRRIGLEVPQVRELAECLNRRYNCEFSFDRMQTAVNALQRSLEKGVRDA